MADHDLKTKHRLNRLRCIRSYINPDNMGGKYFYEPMHSTFHLLLRAAPVKKVDRNSPHVTKVMFLWVVARPKLISGRYSNGKVGCWPIARLSNDRASGSWIISISESSVFDNYKQMMIEKVLPALRSGCPRSISHNSDGTPRVLFLQADSSFIHFKLGKDPVFLAACRADGYHFELRRQPPLSPDLNVVHLGFFNHMQSSPTWRQQIFSTPEAVITAVYQAWRDYSNEALNDVYLTLQSVMTATICDAGNNGYEFPEVSRAPVPVSLHINEEQWQKLNNDISSLTQQLAVEEGEARVAKRARQDEAKRYSEPPGRLTAMLEGFDNFCAQFPEALNKTNPQG